MGCPEDPCGEASKFRPFLVLRFEATHSGSLWPVQNGGVAQSMILTGKPLHRGPVPCKTQGEDSGLSFNSPANCPSPGQLLIRPPLGRLHWRSGHPKAKGPRPSRQWRKARGRIFQGDSRFAKRWEKKVCQNWRTLSPKKRSQIPKREFHQVARLTVEPDNFALGTP